MTLSNYDEGVENLVVCKGKKKKNAFKYIYMDCWCTWWQGAVAVGSHGSNQFSPCHWVCSSNEWVAAVFASSTPAITKFQNIHWNFMPQLLMSLKLNRRSNTENFTVRKSTVFCDVKNWVAISLADPLNALAHSWRPHIEPIWNCLQAQHNDGINLHWQWQSLPIRLYVKTVRKKCPIPSVTPIPTSIFL